MKNERDYEMTVWPRNDILAQTQFPVINEIVTVIDQRFIKFYKGKSCSNTIFSI